MDGHGAREGGTSARLENAPMTAGFFLLAVSPKEDFFNQLLLKQPSTMLRYVPPWKWDELNILRAALFHTVTEEEARDLFDFYGGVPRQILEQADKASVRQALDDAIIRAALSLPSIVKMGPLAGTGLSDKVLLISVAVDKNDQYTFMRGKVDFRSPRIGKEILLAAEGVTSAETLYEIERMPLRDAAVAGYYLEAASLPYFQRGVLGRVRQPMTTYARGQSSFVAGIHETLTNFAGLSGSPFSLLKNGEFLLRFPTVVSENVIKLLGNRARQLACLSQLKVGQYGLPWSSDKLAAVDYVLLLPEVTILFQCTVLPSHPINSTGLTSALKSLPTVASRQVAFLFVVPETTKFLTNFDDYKVTPANWTETATAVKDANADALARGLPGGFTVALGVLAVPTVPKA